MSHTIDPTSTTPKIDCAKQRDGKGRFIEGNNGGPGNPFGRRVGELRQAMLETVSKDDLAEIMQAMIARAKKGDVQAAKLVMAYAVGKPEPAKDPDRLNIEEWGIHKETAQMSAELPKVMMQPPAYIPLHVASATRNGVGLLREHQLNDFFAKERARPTSEPAPSPNGFSPAAGQNEPPSPNGKTVEWQPGMREFYDKLVERGFAVPLPSGDGRR